MTNLQEIFVGKLEEKTQLSRPRIRWNSRAQDKEQWRILANMTIISGVDGLPICSTELVYSMQLSCLCCLFLACGATARIGPRPPDC